MKKPVLKETLPTIPEKERAQWPSLKKELMNRRSWSEQEILDRKGHRSEMGVRAYKRGNADIACTVSKALDPPEPKCPKKEP